jgi:hypothetical protein
MVLPPGHQREIRTPRKFSFREKWWVGVVSACLVAFAIVIVIAVASPPRKSAPGCVDVSIVGATGAAAVHQCGANARALCGAVDQPGGYSGETGKEIDSACRKDGFPVG